MSNRPHWPKRRVIVCDIDNCISLDTHRQYLILPKDQSPYKQDWARYHMYHLACVGDKADFIEELKDDVRRRYDVYFFTAMPEAYRRLRVKWFVKHGKRPSPDHIWMRANYDSRSSVEVKRDMMRRLLGICGQIHMAYDDRLDILNMYASEFGVNTTHRSLDGDGHYND
jgi:hypothetical protein